MVVMGYMVGCPIVQNQRTKTLMSSTTYNVTIKFTNMIRVPTCKISINLIFRCLVGRRELNILEKFHDMIILFFGEIMWWWISFWRFRGGIRVRWSLNLSASNKLLPFGELKIRGEAMEPKTLLNGMTRLFAIFADRLIFLWIKMHSLTENSILMARRRIKSGIRAGSSWTKDWVRGEHMWIRINLFLFLIFDQDRVGFLNWWHMNHHENISPNSGIWFIHARQERD